MAEDIRALPYPSGARSEGLATTGIAGQSLRDSAGGAPKLAYVDPSQGGYCGSSLYATVQAVLNSSGRAQRLYEKS